ncbi:MAG: hypothetical protein K2X76_15280 [Sphingomonas sp.]|nr:hypothetical protein [Sphingomonas sp.]
MHAPPSQLPGDEGTAPPDPFAGAREIARVSSQAPGAPRWTELAVYHRPGSNRPWLATVEGHSTVPGERLKRQFVAMGTLQRALAWFVEGELASNLLHAVELQTAPAAHPFETLGEALAWLYPGEDSDNAKARAFQRDFGMPERTTRLALAAEAGRTEAKAGPWVAAIVKALRYLDRDAWEADHA